MNKRINFTTGLTHCGIFHADDVFSVAILKILNPDIEIKRVFKVPEALTDDVIVFDIGFGRYDHHQKDKKRRDNGIPYAAFGLLWKDFGHLLVSQDNVAKFDTAFIQALDHSDNGGPITPLYSVISAFQPNWDEDNQNMDEAFFKAVDSAQEILEKQISKIKSSERAEELVVSALEDSGNGIVILPRYCPWENILIPLAAKFVVFPSLRGGYSAQAIPSTLGGRDQKIPFPTEWAGKTGAEASALCEGMTFCHAGRFMVSTDTVSNAIKACKMAIEMGGETA